MNLNEIKKEVHNNALRHGWWDEERDVGETFALIHAELSEALEEARAGRANVWHGGDGKPEGIAVELIDAAIRMLDYMGHTDTYIGGSVKELIDYERFEIKSGDIRNIGREINDLHGLVHTAYRQAELNEYQFFNNFQEAARDLLARIFYDVDYLGCVAEALLNEKHEYNKGRPYRHGKRF